MKSSVYLAPTRKGLITRRSAKLMLEERRGDKPGRLSPSGKKKVPGGQLIYPNLKLGKEACRNLTH